MSDQANDATQPLGEGQGPVEPNPGEEPVCAECGAPIGPDDLYCPNCGISLVAG